MSTATYEAGLMPSGGYWQLPDTEKQAFRRKLRDLWHLPPNRTPTERQMLYILASYNRTLRYPIFFGGAMGGAKSAAQCMLAIHLCREIPNNRVMMCRKEFKAFKGSTLQELEEQLEACPDAHHSPGNFEVRFTNGSEIWYMGVGTPRQRERLGSYQFGAILPDEAPEIEHDVVRMLQTRLRWKPAGRAKRLVLGMTGNPYPGWIKQDFVTAPKPGYTFIQSRAADNEHLQDGYVEDMKAEMPEEWYRAFILGDWDAMVPTLSVVPPKLVEAAKKRREPLDLAFIVWGIDCGHLGEDSTVIARKAGFKFDLIDDWKQLYIPDTVDRICHHYRETAYQPHRMVIDYDGIGAGVADGLMRKQADGELPMALEIVGLHAQAVATVDAPGSNYAQMRYANMKAQNAFEFRRMLERGRGQIPLDDDLEMDLTTPTYDVVGGRVVMETKKLVKKKLGRSPDKGDALWLTMWAGSPDEIAGLPENADRLISLTDDDAEMEYYRQMEDSMKRAQWYRNPFGIPGVRIDR